MGDAQLALAGPGIALAVALVLWAAWTASTTPWAAHLPPAPDAELAGWPPRTAGQVAGARLIRWSFAAQVAGYVLVLGGLMTEPGARLLGRSQSVALASVSIGVALTVVRVPAYVLSYLAVRQILPSDPRASASWWLKRGLGVAYVTIAGAGILVTAVVDRLRARPADGWQLLVLAAAIFATLLAGRLALGNRSMASAPTPDVLRQIGDVLLPVSGVRKVRIVAAVTRSAHLGAATVHARPPVVAIRPDVLEASSVEVLTGLVAHELSHVKHHHAPIRVGQTLLALLVAALAGMAAISTPVLRHAVHAGDVSDSRVLPLYIASALLTWRLLASVALASWRRQETQADLDAMLWAPPDGVAPFLRENIGTQLVDPRYPLWQRLFRVGHPDPVDRVALPRTTAAASRN